MNTIQPTCLQWVETLSQKMPQTELEWLAG